MARQLVLDLGLKPSFDPDDFLESPSNAEALAMVEHWPNWSDRVLLLIGPPGSGKSHLGAIWATLAGARVFQTEDTLDLVGWSGAALIEDCDRAVRLESEVFHLLNLVREREGWLMLTARTVPGLWNLRTPDLLSRLRRAPVVSIGRPDPSLVRAVIVKLFADRQITIEEDVVAYAARHCEQSLEAVNLFVSAVDEASLEKGRRITRPLASSTIAALERGMPPAGGEPGDPQGPT